MKKDQETFSYWFLCTEFMHTIPEKTKEEKLCDAGIRLCCY